MRVHFLSSQGCVFVVDMQLVRWPQGVENSLRQHNVLRFNYQNVSVAELRINLVGLPPIPAANIILFIVTSLV